MIMGHIGFGGAFDKLIHVFNMPMFFLISGYFYNEKRKMSVLLKELFRKLIIPYLAVGFIYYFVYVVINGYGMHLKYINCLFWNSVNLPIGGAIWFLLALFWTELLYKFLDICVSFRKRRITFSCIIICLVVFGLIFSKSYVFRLPFAIDVSFVAIGFYHIGFLLKVHKNIFGKILNINIIWVLLILIMGVIFSYFNGYVNMRTMSYSNVLMYVVSSLICVYIILYFSKKIERIFGSTMIVREIKFIGSNSMIYLCFNQLLLMVILKAQKIMGIYRNSIALNSIYLFVILIFLHIACKVINRVKVGYNLGA